MSLLTAKRESKDRRTSPPSVGRAPSLLDSFNYAFEGIIHVLRTQRNLRIHFVIAIGVIAAAAALGVQRMELIVLLLAIAFVLVCGDGELRDRGCHRRLDHLLRPECEAREGYRRGCGSHLLHHRGCRRLSGLRARRRASKRAAARQDSRRTGGDHARGARARDSHRDRDEGVDRPRDSIARRPAVRARRRRVRRLDGGRRT